MDHVTNERPVIFSGDMVRAILDGRKTMTRRVIKKAMWPFVEEVLRVNGHWTFEVMDGTIISPYGYPGDRLWVRETHVFESYEDEPKSSPDRRPIFYYKGDGTEWDEPYWLYPHYRATDPAPDLYYEDGDGMEMDDPQCKWRPSIFMPRWASRITLEIVNIQVERVQEISRDDSFREGVEAINPYAIDPNLQAGWPAAFKDYQNKENFFTANPIASFQTLWNSINGKSGFGWDVNPWVWVIDFKTLEDA